MLRSQRPLAALLAALALALATAQPPQPAAPPPIPPAAEQEGAEARAAAMVRFVHLSPNAPPLGLTLSLSGGESRVAPEAFGGLAYAEASDYLPVPEGGYTAIAQGADGAPRVEQDLRLAAGRYYTVAALGMVLPEAEAEAGSEEQGGLLGFVRSLIEGGEAAGDDLSLRLTLVEDDFRRPLEQGAAALRLVHAAPGTEQVDLAARGQQGVLIDNVRFGESSLYANFDGPLEELEVRVGGSRAAALSLGDAGLQPGAVNTVYLMGTPLEEAPLRALAFAYAPLPESSEGAAGTPEGAGE